MKAQSTPRLHALLKKSPSFKRKCTFLSSFLGLLLTLFILLADSTGSPLCSHHEKIDVFYDYETNCEGISTKKSGQLHISAPKGTFETNQKDAEKLAQLAKKDGLQLTGIFLGWAHNGCGSTGQTQNQHDQADLDSLDRLDFRLSPKHTTQQDGTVTCQRDQESPIHFRSDMDLTCRIKNKRNGNTCKLRLRFVAQP